MALTLDEAIRRQRVADALSSLDLGPSDLPTDSSLDQDTAAEAQAESETNQQLAEATTASKSDTPDVPKHVEDAYGDWKKWPTVSPSKAMEPVTAESVVEPSPSLDQPSKIPTMAPAVPSPLPESTTEKETTQPGPFEYFPFLGPRSYEQQAVREILGQPKLEPITEESVGKPELRPPGHVDLGVPGHEDLGPPPAPDTLDQVERATLVKLPAKPAPDTLTQVEKALPAGQPATDTLPQVEKALPTGLKAPGTHTELAPPGQMDLREDTDKVSAPEAKPPTVQPVTGELAQGPPGTHPQGTQDEPYWPKRPEQISQLPPGSVYIDPTDGSIKTTPGTAAAPTTTQPATAPTAAEPAVKPVAGDWRTWTTVDGTPAGPQAAAKPAPQADIQAGGGTGLSQVRSRFAQELTDNSSLRNRLIASIQAEVGDQGPEAKLAYTESVMNRAIARGQTLYDTISDLNYYPTTTTSKLSRKISSDESAYVDPIIQRALGGSNLANFATGNESGNVHSHGAQVTYNPQTGERFVLENPDVGWEKGITATRSQQQPAKEAWESWPTLPQADADKAIQEAQVGTLQNIANKSTNLIGLYKQLDQPVENIQDPIRQEFQGRIKDQIIKLMQEREPNLSADDAWKKAQSDIGPLEVGADFWNKFVGSFQQFQPLLQQAFSVKNEQSHVNAFLDQALPNGSDADKQALLTKLYNTPREQRGALVQSLIPNPQTGVPGADPNEIVSALDRLSNPDYAKEQDKAMAKAKEDFRARMLTDPRLPGTGAEKAVDAIAQIPEMLAAAGFTPALAAQVSQQVRDQMKAEHPEYSEDELDQKAAYSTLVQIVGQEAAGRIMGAGMGAIIKGVKSPVQRAIAQALGNMAVGGVTSAGAQAGSNIATGKPVGEGVLGAGESGLIQGGVVGAVHGAGELEPRPAEPQPTTGKEGAPIRGAEDKTLEQPPAQPVTAQSVLGPDVPDTSMRWHDPTQPIVTRGTERTTFTPAELAEQAGTVTGKTPEELRAAAEQLKPPTDFNQRAAWFLGDEGTQETQQAQRAQAPSPSPTLAEAIQQQRAAATAASLGATPPRQGGVMSAPLGSAQIKVRNIATGKSDAVLIARDDTAFTGKKAAFGDTQVPPYQVHGPFPIEGHTVHAPGDIHGFRTDTEVYQAIKAAADKHGWTIESDPKYKYAEPWIDKFKRATSPPVRVGEADPYVSKIANRYTAERMATGELGPIDPSEGKSTEQMVMQGLKMSPEQRERLIDNFTKGKGGDLDTQGAAIRSKETLLSVQSKDASRAAEADPTNSQLQAQAKAALDELTAFHNGPIKKFKKDWSNAGRSLQREIPLDYTTLNGMKEAVLKSTNKEAPLSAEPKLKQMANSVSKAANAERAAMNNLGKEIEARTRGNPVTDESVRTRLMEIMKDFPCRN
jgi:hypothetical protein